MPEFNEDKEDKDLEASEWNLLNADGVMIDNEPTLFEGNFDCSHETENLLFHQKERNSVARDEYTCQNTECDNIAPVCTKKWTKTTRSNFITLLLKIIVTVSIFLLAFYVASNFYQIYKLENMIGNIDDFVDNYEHKKMAIEKCRQAHAKNIDILEACIESQMDSDSCLDYHRKMMGKNQDFCNWDVDSILDEKKKWLRNMHFRDRISKLRDSSTEYFSQVLHLVNISRTRTLGLLSLCSQRIQKVIFANALDIASYTNLYDLKNQLSFRKFQQYINQKTLIGGLSWFKRVFKKVVNKENVNILLNSTSQLTKTGIDFINKTSSDLAKTLRSLWDKKEDQNDVKSFLKNWI